MKKIIFTCICILPLLFGCSKNYESELKEVGNNYYNSYVKNKVEGLDKVEVTLGELRIMKKINLDSVKECKDNTKIIMTIKNNKIVNYDFEQNCK